METIDLYRLRLIPSRLRLQMYSSHEIGQTIRKKNKNVRIDLTSKNAHHTQPSNQSRHVSSLVYDHKLVKRTDHACWLLVVKSFALLLPFGDDGSYIRNRKCLVAFERRSAHGARIFSPSFFTIAVVDR